MKDSNTQHYEGAMFEERSLTCAPTPSHSHRHFSLTRFSSPCFSKDRLQTSPTSKALREMCYFLTGFISLQQMLSIINATE